MGLQKPHTRNPRSHFTYSLCNFYGAMMMINDSLLVSIPIVKRFSIEIFLSPAKTGPKNGGFSRKWGSKRQSVLSKPPKRTSLRGTVSFDVFCVKSVWGPRLWAKGTTQKTKYTVIAEPEKLYFTHMGRKKLLGRSGQNFALGKISGK